MYSFNDMIDEYRNDQYDYNDNQIFILKNDNNDEYIHLSVVISRTDYNGEKCFMVLVQSVDSILSSYKLITESKY